MRKIISALIIASSCAIVTGCGFNNCGGCASYTAYQYTTTSGCCGYTTSCCGTGGW